VLVGGLLPRLDVPVLLPGAEPGGCADDVDDHLAWKQRRDDQTAPTTELQQPCHFEQAA